jgi:hypothetical protein
MAQRFEDTYYAVPSDTMPRCVVTGCIAPVVAEVYDGDYAVALRIFRGVKREKIRSRRVGDERLYVCSEHLENDRRMAKVQWQWLMF